MRVNLWDRNRTLRYMHARDYLINKTTLQRYFFFCCLFTSHFCPYGCLSGNFLFLSCHGADSGHCRFGVVFLLSAHQRREFSLQGLPVFRMAINQKHPWNIEQITRRFNILSAFFFVIFSAPAYILWHRLLDKPPLLWKGLQCDTNKYMAKSKLSTCFSFQAPNVIFNSWKRQKCKAHVIFFN